MSHSRSGAPPSLRRSRWQDRPAWEAFVGTHRGAYEDLDRLCASLIATEREIGSLRLARLDDAGAIADALIKSALES